MSFYINLFIIFISFHPRISIRKTSVFTIVPLHRCSRIVSRDCINIFLLHVVFVCYGWLFLFWVLWQTVFNLGLAMLVGALNVHFRDTQHLVGVGLSAWFFLSPVMYNMDFAANLASRWPWAVDLLYANPMAILINGYRAALLPGAPAGFPPAGWVGFALVPATLFLGAWTYRRLQKNFADML